jgi:peptidoglycan/xylan/chitin deacetylase (PgdA/CDA1 family)/peptidoglycan hydrolase-like protein with peptidoglycan-binding domain
MGQSVVISRISTNERVMALTFDDGSDSANTKAILDILQNYGVKSTFFLTGQSADRYPNSAKLILQSGHEIGNHSYAHPRMTQISTSAMITEIQKCETAVNNSTGKYPLRLFRPPYGSYNSVVLSAVGAAGYPWTVMWTIDTLDWAGTPRDTMVQKVLNNARPGAIVLMHVGSGTNTQQALPIIISELKNRGYRFIKLSEMLSLPEIPSHPFIRRGSTGSDVIYLQLSLTKLGYKPGAADGIFGPQTEQAVKLFQSNKGLVVDGIVGNNTWNAIEIALHTPSPSPSRPLLKRGSTGSDVVYLQQSLTKLGYNPGSSDGIFGPRTEQAVKDFQADKGLVVDGIVGRKTWAAIEASL